MPIIIFKPSGKKLSVPPGTDLLDASLQAGVGIEASCGGKGTCGKCAVRITSGTVDYEPASDILDGYYLACKSKVTNDDIVVSVPEMTSMCGGKFLDDAQDINYVNTENYPTASQHKPLVSKICTSIPDMEVPVNSADSDRIAFALEQVLGKAEIIYALSALRGMADALHAESGIITCTYIDREACAYVFSIESGNTTDDWYGITVDIGTTTVSLQLVHIPTGHIIVTKTDYNDQISCGLDVISRINFAKRKNGLNELRSRILMTVNRLIRCVVNKRGIRPSAIVDAVVSGNTTMIHLLLGLNPEYIRLSPYTPTFFEISPLSAQEVGMDINPSAPVSVSPAVGSYVGGDITAGELCMSHATSATDISMLIDIGTNGELVIGNNEFLVACACSAGPAFEGGGIECGMRAATGAIEKVDVDPVNGAPAYFTVGDSRPQGICGSGMISLLANLFLKGWVDAAGKLDRSRPSPAVEIKGRHAKYIIAPAGETESGKPVYVSESDINNIIRAKAAIYAACSLIMSRLELSFDDLRHVYIAGNFGRFLDLEKAITIGLFPAMPLERFSYIGNSSLTGSYMVLISREHREKQYELAHRMTYIDLGADPAYMDHFTAALFLPHTDSGLFHKK